MKRIVLPAIIIMTMFLAACGNGKNAPSTSDTGGTPPVSMPANEPAQTLTEAPTGTPAPAEGSTPEVSSASTETPVPTEAC